jgi:membrane-bound lytic murein transglycosylase B
MRYCYCLIAFFLFNALGIEKAMGQIVGRGAGQGKAQNTAQGIAQIGAQENSAIPAPSSFRHWIEKIKKKARAKGISKATLQKAFHKVHYPLDDVIRLDRNQPEIKTPFGVYYEKRVPGLIPKGKKFLKKHKALLQKTGKKYGIPPEIIVALWGMETHYGKVVGKTSTIHALATLAYEGRRADFFTDELFHALHILEEKHIEPHHMIGSWAGAIGQCQFMPSSFRRDAVDETGKGRKDIWNTLPDIFGSTANFLKNAGWRINEPCVYEVTLPENFPPCSEVLEDSKSLEEWAKLGITRKNNQPLADSNLQAFLICPKKTTRTFLVFENIHAILKWNRSLNFALSVGLLANEIRGSALGRVS